MRNERILMVCLGNICRSPMAEGLLRHHVQRGQLDVEVDSAGTANYHVGEEPDHRAIRCMKENGIDISRLRARQFSVRDFDDFDRIYVMDHSNYQNVMSLAKNDSHKAKVKLLLNEIDELSNAPVPDPWFGDMSDFDAVFNMLDEAAQNIVLRLAASK